MARGVERVVERHGVHGEYVRLSTSASATTTEPMGRSPRLLMNPFFVTGLPRSRTAWLANLFTTDQTICWHDRRFEEALTINPKRVGFSGPELVTQFEHIRELFPKSPWLVVLRNADEALTSFKLAAGDLLPQDDLLLKFWKDRCHLLSQICTHANVTTVAFSELNNEEVIRAIWARILPDIAFDVQRWEMLSKLNVQQTIKEPWPC